MGVSAPIGSLAVGIWLALTAPAAALCTCDDRDGCSSAAACSGLSPGDTCGSSRTCKIVVGEGSGITCCCGCSKGTGPIGCNYGVLGPVNLSGGVACGSEALASLSNRVEAAATARLARADAACRAEKNAQKKADAAEAQLARLRSKIERFARRGRIEGPCATAALALIDAVVGDIAAVGAGEGGGGGGPTTSTTSTTLLGGPACSGTFIPSSDPFEVDFQLGCFAAGASYQGFALQMKGGREVAAFVEPPGFVCSIQTRASTNDTLACTGNFNVDVPVMGGRIRTLPAPEPDMSASLFVLVGTTPYGPFPTSGP